MRLRKLKHRDHKPFAVMVPAWKRPGGSWNSSGRAEEACVRAACPIVLGRSGRGDKSPTGVAPQNHRLGVMLPYTPIHHLLFNRGAGWWWRW